MPETPKTIRLIGNGRLEEGMSGSNGVVPGHLMKLSGTNTYAKHNTAGGVAERLFAVEDALVGKGVDETIYSVGDRVTLYVAQPGDVVLARLAANQTVSAGALLSSNGDGTLRLVDTGHTPVAVALEDKSSSPSVQKIKVRVL